MADLQVLRFPQSKSIDAVRFLTPPAAFSRFIVAAVNDGVEIHTLNTPDFRLQSSWPIPSRISSLRVSQTPQKPVIAAATIAGSFHLLFVDPVEASLESELSLSDKSFHAGGGITSVDLDGSRCECVSAGEDGRVNLVRFGESRLNCSLVSDSRGLVAYSAARWGSPAEFATGGLGHSVQWWDQRKPGGAAVQSKGDW
ncbi:hypothetical protein ACLOJK_028241 [Asimina triloba]